MSETTVETIKESDVLDTLRNTPPDQLRHVQVEETVFGTILESEIPEGTGRFPQWGSEHPDRYREFYVECFAQGGSYAPLRGRAVDGDAAVMPYLNQANVNPDHSPKITVREIIEPEA